MKMVRFMAIMLTFGTLDCYGGGLIHVVSHLFHFHNKKNHSWEDKMNERRDRGEAVKRCIEARKQGKKPSKSDIVKEAKAYYNNDIV